MTGCTIARSNGPVFTRTFVRDPYRKHQINVVSNSVDGASVHSTAYAHDLLSRRTNIVMTAQTGTNTLSCAYNARNEVTGVTIHTNDYAYIYDNIGNSLYSSLNTVTNAYTVNNLNQYTAITDPVNPVNPVYDLDGNMVTNGVWSFTYDAENRMVDAYSNDTLLASNTYDHQSRRIRKAVFASSDHSFIWDSWNLIHERVSHTNGTVDEIEYVWGLDLSGTRQGAGGVGGLLFEKRNGVIYIPCYDANGNITAYVDTNGTVRAYRQFDAFGNTIAKGGDMVDVLHFWYSTKYLDHDTGLYYYGYRYYSAMLQRWINRDPIGERGGVNMYGFVENNGVNMTEYLGRFMIAPVGSSPSASFADDHNKEVKSLYAGVYIILSDKDLAQMPNGGMLVHGKRVTINLRDRDGKSVVNDTQALTKLIRINSNGIGRKGSPDLEGKRWPPNYPSTDDDLLEAMPIYYNLLARKMENCVEGEIIIKANWYLFNNKYGDTLDVGGDALSGSLDGLPTHGSIGSVPGWPKVDKSYFAAGSYYVTIKITKSSPYFDVTPYANPLWRGTPLNRSDRVMDNVTHYTKWK